MPHQGATKAEGPRTYRVRVLGCRVNHAERRELCDALRSRGMAPAARGKPADLEVVHTCTVTKRAAAKSRQVIRRAAREAGHDPTVLVTGCLVGTEHETLQSLAPGVASAIGHDEPMVEAVGQWVDKWLGQSASLRTEPPQRSLTPLPLAVLPNAPAQHTRAEVRVQDGCDAWCTFCIIPRTRPRLRTKSIATVVQEVDQLVQLGHQEVVLAGIFLGAYGHETALRRKQTNPDAEPLAELIDAVANVPGLARLRLSSLEPGDVTETLLDAMVTHREIVTGHLHLPLQSGSDEVLKRMNRQYRVGEYLDMIEQVTSRLQSSCGIPPALTTDIICGFPGEDDAAFEQTLEVVRQVCFLHLHVFPYSPHPGTAAARWQSKTLPMATRRERVRRLMALEGAPDGWSQTYRRNLIGHTLRVIPEQTDPHRPNRWLGRCDQYAMLSVKGPLRRGQIVRAIATTIDDDVLLADAVEVSTPLSLLTQSGPAKRNPAT
ncbi:MAG: MiaB/RimO family radical SAM methylthiotransferase [Phycisphaerales bacterium]|nr:MiaB/RimO family radical SAM methylthiotransferase [Phycisphaerales bacterium]